MKLPEWTDAADTEPGTIECPTDPGDVRWCACGQPWIPAAGLYGTTDETQCQACTLRGMLSRALDTLAAERAKRCETCGHWDENYRRGNRRLCWRLDDWLGCGELPTPKDFGCTLWEPRTIAIEAAAEFVRE